MREPCCVCPPECADDDTGDTCIVNTQECLHAASIPKAGTFRDILQFEIMPAAQYRTGDALFADVPPDLAVRRMRVP